MNRKALPTFIFICVLPFSLFAETILLSPHETRYFEVPPDAKVEVSRSDIVTVKDLTTQIMIRAKKRGNCTVKVGKKLYQINVVSSESALGYRKLDKGKYRGLTISPEKDGVTVRGRLLALSDYKELTRSLESGWNFAGEVPKDLQTDFSTYVQEELKSLGRPPVQLRFKPHPLVLLPKGQLETYRPALRQLGLTHSISEDLIAPKNSMSITVVFAEIDNKAAQTFGLQLPSSTQFQVLPALESPQEVLAQLDHLAGRGLARKYAQPKIQVTSGKVSKFVSGGELPIKTSGFSSSRVDWKNYGFILEIKPKFDESGQIDLEFFLELSALDPAAGADGIPGIKKRTFETHIFSHEQKPMVVGNFFELQDSVQTSELPFLSKVPLLGELFKSENYLEQKSRGYILILPNF